MNCVFCAAESAPQAKFCSECGSPLSLKICPTCTAVNEKTASTCLKCRYTFALQHEPGVAVSVPQMASLPAATLASDAVVDARPHEWELLLHEIEQEVHRQLEAEQHAPAAPNGLSLATPTAHLAANRSLVNSHSTEYTGRSSETRRTRSRLSGLVAILTVVLIGGAGAPYLLSSSSATTPPAKHDNASPNQTAAAPQLISPARDLPPGDEVDRGDSAAAASSATATRVSLEGPQLVPAYDNENNALSTTAEAKNDAESIPLSVAPPADVVLDERKQDQAAPPAARKATPPHRTSATGSERAVRISSLPGEHRVIAEAPALYPAQPAAADSQPCSAGVRALALCSGPSQK
jgi:ribosomal protein L40E